MKKEPETTNPPPDETPFHRFERLARKLARVPKEAAQERKPSDAKASRSDPLVG